MQITEHTETKLIFKPEENRFLYTGLLTGSVFVFVGILMLGADFRTNSNYAITSAQNLNSFMKILASLSMVIGLAFGLTGMNNQDNAYTFDKKTSTFRITGKRSMVSHSREYPICSIQEVVVNRAAFTQNNVLPDDYSYFSGSSNPDEFFISLRLGKEIAPEAPENIFLLYQSSNFQLINEFADTIRNFLGIDLQ